MQMSSGEPAVLNGAMMALRVFDVAYSIDLARAEALWAQHTRKASSRGRLNTAPSKAIAFDVPPVIVALDSCTIALPAGEMTATLTARLYDFGVVALSARVAIENWSWQRYVDGFNALDLAVGARADTAFWAGLLDRLAPLRPALTRPNDATLQEDYLIALVQRWSEPMTAADIERRVDLVPLLSGEARPLSASARHELLRQRHSYYDDDLVVLTWDRAFLYEPRGESDVADVIEVANAQLVELRYYDELLDDELPKMYHLVEAARGGRSRFASPRHYSRLAHRFYSLVAEVTELTEKVDNALQVTEDVYLARVYSAALDLFRVPTVGAAVDRKLAIIRDTYRALYDEASGARGAMMELAIVVLILFEIVLALLGG
jgi:hypothetical protein